MLNIETFKHNAIGERIVDNICKKIGTDERSFFRIHVAYYFAVMASSMRCQFLEPGATRLSRPVNNYSINLAPSGFGKGYSTFILEEHIINMFREKFLDETMPILITHNLAKIADHRARKYVEDPETMRVRVENEFKRTGAYDFAFTKPTEASIVQLRQKMLMAGIGSINLQVDEIGANLFKTKDALPTFLELYDGKLKNNLTKSSSENQRGETMYGITPTNMMLFGVPSALLDDGKNEEEFTNMNETGYARRCLFGYVSDEQYQNEMKLLSPAEHLERAKKGDADSDLEDVSILFESLADPLNANMRLLTPDDTALLMFEYKNLCRTRAMAMPAQNHIARTEAEHRHDKAMRLAATYAFIESAPQIELHHLQSAIKLTEESGDAFTRIMHRDTPPIKLAKFLGSSNTEYTKVTLRAQLPYFKGGSAQSRDEMLREAMDWGYTNNISIKRRFSSGVEFYSGEYLKSNDLTELRISYGKELAFNYRSVSIPWDKIVQLATVSDVNYVNHHLEGGFDGAGHRHQDACIPGFNMVIIDVDGGVTIQAAKKLLEGYKAFFYVTKRHNATDHRFRIIMPINYTLELDADDFSAFMANLYEWLPFKADEQTGTRSKKWLTNAGHYMFTDGVLLDALPFIPRTQIQQEHAERLVDIGNLGGLERWFILNTSSVKGNRNNNLHRYGMLLVDGGIDIIGAKDRIMAINAKLDKPLTESEIDSTVMRTISKALKTRKP